MVTLEDTLLPPCSWGRSNSDIIKMGHFVKKLLTGFIPADLMRRQEELRRMEELHNQEMQKRKEIQLRLVWLSWGFIQSYICFFFLFFQLLTYESFYFSRNTIAASVCVCETELLCKFLLKYLSIVKFGYFCLSVIIQCLYISGASDVGVSWVCSTPGV